MTREIMHQMDNMDKSNNVDNDSQLTEKVERTNKLQHPRSQEYNDLLKRQQFIFAQLLREANRQEPKRLRSVSGYDLFRREQRRVVCQKEWNALPLATRARYHELAAEKVRLYKERLVRKR